MRINEIHDRGDVVLAKLKEINFNFSSDEDAIMDYCKNNHRTGDVNSLNICNNAIDSLIKDIDKLLNNNFVDDRLLLFQENATRIKSRLINLKNTLT